MASARRLHYWKTKPEHGYLDAHYPEYAIILVRHSRHIEAIVSNSKVSREIVETVYPKVKEDVPKSLSDKGCDSVSAGYFAHQIELKLWEVFSISLP